MQAIVVRKPGGYDRLSLEEREAPVVHDPAEVLIEVSHIGVNYADCLVRLGLYKSARDLDRCPLVPGFDFSGRVVAVGDRVESFVPGDRVFGVTLFGAYQTELVVDQAYIRHVPPEISLAIAASLPTAFLTAFYILRHATFLRHGENLLVRSAAGGVGSWLMILGVRIGARVTGIVSTSRKRISLSGREGVRVCVETDVSYESSMYDVIANAQGGASMRRDLKMLRPRGRLALYGFHGMVRTSRSGRLTLWSWARIVLEYIRTPRIDPFTLVNQNKSVIGFNLSYLSDRTDLYEEAMAELLTILRTPVVLPPVTEVPFSEVAHAHRMLESGAVIGKLVLAVPRESDADVGATGRS